jgi:S-adenosylmethionine synthetase
MYYQFTSESVSEGHPDKVADQISDAVLDAYLAQDPHAKVAIECLITSQHLTIAGEVKASLTKPVDVVAIAQQTLDAIGYNALETGFDWHTATYQNLVHEQSAEINASVADGGAGDQGLMFGYASNETQSLMPLPLALSHQLVSTLADWRKSGKVDWLRPDAKSQVTVAYESGEPKEITRVVLSTQHHPDVSQETIRDFLTNELILPTLGNYYSTKNLEILVNPSGSFVVGGPHGDTGLTGRKIIVDTYGGACSHGGGAFSGKDPSKVDRSAAYFARYVAKHLVAAHIAKRCTIQVSYAIGKEEPTSLYVNLHGTGHRSEADVLEFIQSYFDFRPNSIIETLQLKQPIYSPTARYGHFGNEVYPWEQINKAIISDLQNELIISSSM